jgi:hypothetical protein
MNARPGSSSAGCWSGTSGLFRKLAGLRNGELLAAADGEFDVFITTDKNLRHQQNLAKYSFAVLLLPSNQVPVVEALIPAIEGALATISAGDLVELRLP